jgi:hypothetical protein
MKLVQLSPRSIENLMTRPESLPLSLDDLLVSIPMDWREQSFGRLGKVRINCQPVIADNRNFRCNSTDILPSEPELKFGPDHAVGANVKFLRSLAPCKGTAEMAIGEMPTKRRIWLPPENALQFHHHAEPAICGEY